ncbi:MULTISPECIES: beta-ketoacyl-ACP reductase [Petrotoga]|uniref:3-oxoacyl-[acyl-carrier-protein] reductase n=2 Tax=Petrotoga sibirica TaxID=156202 RepID=A0A4R8EY12_9BACT|nr:MULTISPECIES: beta-ketoacyl-ACP reductase [Petrotoga]POZ88861.1 3-ketoacyl-ACP reductase [Petrotoga sibirica DSM 13575]POZ90979.1 3-ketoacyl-ACP reductase [Petrotoga sp. SL27]TDX17489.1 3-oxoacyl-[acyl-carrier-protein] reductase [Petrotoga sibirica]
MKLNQKIAIVTGGSRGIGKEISRNFIKEGANVIAIAIDERPQIEENEKSDFPEDRFIYYQADITDFSTVSEIVTQIYNKYQKIDILVNNAGMAKDNFLVIMKEEDFDKVIQVNLKGTFIMTKAVAKIMRKQKFGNIINMASVVGMEGNIGQTNYSAAKAGIIGMTKSWAKELTMKGENIRVNAIAPGFVKTGMTKSLKEELVEYVVENTCLKRLGEPQDIAKLAVFLASDDSSFITGQVIRIDGGLRI